MRKQTAYVLVLWLTMCHTLYAQSDSIPKAYIRLYDDTVMIIRKGLGAATLNDRKQFIERNMYTVYKELEYHTDSIHLHHGEVSSDIWYSNERILFSIFEFDVPDSLTREQYAERIYTRFKTVLNYQRNNRSIENYLIRILYTLLLLIFVIIIIRGSGWLFKKLRVWLTKNKDKWTLKRIAIFPQRNQVLFALKFVVAMRWLLVALVVSASLPFLFYIFPDTKYITRNIVSLLLTPAKTMGLQLIAFIPNLITIFVLWFIVHTVVRIIRFAADEITHNRIQIPGFYPEWARTTFNICRFILYVFWLVVIFPYLPGSDSPAFKGVSVFLGLMLSLGSSSAINNIIAGIVLTYMRAFKLGDRIRIGDTVGDVIEKSMLNTRILTPKREEITIPNATVLGSAVVNYSSQTELQGVVFYTSITIGYDTPWTVVHEAMIEAAKRTPGIEHTPDPYVLQKALNDFSVEYQLNAFTKQPNEMERIYSDLHRHIQDVCNERGIEIMSPHYYAHRDGNHTTIPKSYLDATYIPKAFEIKHVDNPSHI